MDETLNLLLILIVERTLDEVDTLIEQDIAKDHHIQD